MQTTSPVFQMIPLAMVQRGNNPRKYFDKSEMDDLVESVRANGIIQPICVRPIEGDRFEVVAGERRFRAAEELNLAEIPAMVQELSDADADAVALVENTARADMSVAEEAEAAGKILDRLNGDREEAARVLGWPLSKLNRRIALLNLIPEAMDSLNERRILVGHAELLASIPMDKQSKALSNIIGKGFSVQQVRDFLANIATDFKNAIFEISACGACNYNSTVQSSLFVETIGKADRCTNGDCYKTKTATKVEEIRADLSEEVQTVMVLEVGDGGFTKLVIDGVSGVGAEQYKACKLCSKLGATVSNIPGEIGKVERDICFDLDCNMEKVAERIKEVAELAKVVSVGQDVPSSSATNTTSLSGKSGVSPKKQPKVAGLSPKIVEYRRKQVWEIACKKELVSHIGKAKAFALDLLLTGDGRLMDKTKLVGYFGKISGTEYPENNGGKKVGSPDLVFGLPEDKFDRMLAAAAVSAVSSAEVKDERIVKLLDFLGTDLTKHFTLSAEFFALLTKSEIEAVCVSVGLDKAVDGFTKVMSGKKDDAIKTILAAEFQFEGAVPSILNYN